MTWKIALLLALGCDGREPVEDRSPAADTDSAPAADPPPANTFTWDLPEEKPADLLEAIWIGRFAEDGDFLCCGATFDADLNVSLLAPSFPPGEPIAPFAAVTILAASWTDVCAVTTEIVQAQKDAEDLSAQGDDAAAAALLQAAHARNPEDFWWFSVGAIALTPEELDRWEVWDFATTLRAAAPALAHGRVSHHRSEIAWDGVLDDPDRLWTNKDTWAPSGPVTVTALDAAAGTLEATGTLALRPCTYPGSFPGDPCVAPSDGEPTGSFTFSLAATRCPALEDVLDGRW